MLNTQKLLSILLIVMLAGCSSGSANEQRAGTLDEKVDQYIEQDRYEEALRLLDGEDKEDPEVRLLLEKTHLNYALNSMSTFDAGEMRTRMNTALIQFVEVLKINPENSVARNQIEQILGVYDTMPERNPEPEAIEALQEVGINP